MVWVNHRLHIVATATLCTFHHKGKTAQPGEGEGRGCMSSPPPFTIFTITFCTKLWCKYTPAERANTLPLFLLYPYTCTLRDKPIFLKFQDYLARVVLLHVLKSLTFNLNHSNCPLFPNNFYSAKTIFKNQQMTNSS